MRTNFYGRGNEAFVCAQCGMSVLPLINGSYRNHCPVCLYTKHVDVIPGDRSATCQGLMKPIGVLYKREKGWVIVHACELCQVEKHNKAAPDDTFDLLCQLAAHQNTT